MATYVSLKDGSRVSLSLVTTVVKQLRDLQEENYVALWDLAMKCQNASHVIAPLPFGFDPKSTLQKYGFLDNRGNVHEDIRLIVLNSVENINEINSKKVCYLVLINPLAKSQTSNPPNSSSWNWCSVI